MDESTMRIRTALTGLVVAATAAQAQQFTKPGPVTNLKPPVTLEREGLFQAAYASVGDDIYIGGQPTEKALRDLKAKGVTVVINLRTPEEMKTAVRFDEEKLIAELGMKYVFLPGRGTPDFPYTPEQVTKFADAVAKADGKVLLHCTVAWRASHMWAAYLIEKRGVPEAQALANARAINLMDDHRMEENGRQPVEDYLNRKLTTLGRPPMELDAGSRMQEAGASLFRTVASVRQAQQPKRPPTNGGLPAVSPDGKWIAFIRNGEGVVAGLYVIGVDGAGEKRLGDAPQSMLAWLPDGSGVYYGTGQPMADSSDIRARKLDGTESLIQRIPGRDAVLTRDMSGIYASSGKFPNLGLVHIPVGTKEVHRLTNQPGMIFNIAINAAEKLVFTHADSSRNMQIYTLGPGNQLKALTKFTESEGRPQWPSWSSDGKTVAVQVGRYDRNNPAANSAHIWLVNIETGATTKLAAHEKAYLDETPSFFPDGKRIAFQSDRSGRMEVWVMNVDGTGARQVTR
jgi:uncharacterized protein (TIGR01244 family)